MDRNQLLQNADFRVGTKPALMERNGVAQPIPKRFATYRQDTGEPLGVVGQRYKVHQHVDTIVHTAGIIDKFTQHYTVKNTVEGARVYTRFMLNDIGVLSNVPNEDARLGIDLLNSHDGSRMVQLDVSMWRLVCTNGMRAFVKEHSLKKMHVKGVTMGAIFEGLPTIVSAYKEGYSKLYNQLKDEKPLGTEIVAKTFTDRLIKNARDAYRQEYAVTKVHTAWTQFQAFARVITHSKFQENRKIELSNTLSNLFLTQFAIA
jgi:hypothetical protein